MVLVIWFVTDSMPERLAWTTGFATAFLLGSVIGAYYYYRCPDCRRSYAAISRGRDFLQSEELVRVETRSNSSANVIGIRKYAVCKYEGRYCGRLFSRMIG